jgi:Methylase involved in ubiquinone/menaquinone biosynthesis
MDYQDYLSGATKDLFWFKAKNGLIEVLLNKLEFENKLKILNLGAGTGDDLSIINRFGETYVIDKNQKALDLIPKDRVVEKKLCDACDISYPDVFFDVVVAFDVLEHIEKDFIALNEIHRILKPSGFFIFTVPAFNFLFSSHDRNLNHFRRYNIKMIRNLLSKFHCLDLGFWVCTLFIPLAIQRLLKRKEAVLKNPYPRLPKIINGFFYYLLTAENFLIKHGIPLPIGTTIFGIYQKR